MRHCASLYICLRNDFELYILHENIIMPKKEIKNPSTGIRFGELKTDIKKQAVAENRTFAGMVLHMCKTYLQSLKKKTK